MSQSSTNLIPSNNPAQPLREVWSIAWPTVLTMTSYTVMQFVDSLMVGQVSPLAVAAQGNGGIWAFTPIAAGMGFVTVVNTYVSQNLGAGRPERGPQYAWAGLWLSALMWLLFFVPLALLFPVLIPLTHSSADVTEFEALTKMEVGYGQILLFGGVLTLFGRTMHHYFFGMHRPKVIAISAVLGNLVNGAANYVLIFGAAGLTIPLSDGSTIDLPGIPGTPALGVYGAAIGTVIGSAVELLIPLSIFLGPKINAQYNSRAQWRPRLKPMRELIKIGWPAAVQYGNEITCWALFMAVLVGTFGEHHMTAGWIALRYMHLSFMPAVGFSVAVTSLVGRYIGAGQPDTAVARARLGLGMSMIWMTLCAGVFFIFREPLVGFFVGGDVTPEEKAAIIDIGAKLMICAAVFQTVDAIGIVYTGALRGAGDTIWPGVITMIYSWLFIVVGGVLMIRFFPQLESVGPWIAASVYIILYGFTMGWRFEKGRWRSIKLLGDDAERDAATIAPIGPGAPALDAQDSVRDLAEEIGEEVAQR